MFSGIKNIVPAENLYLRLYVYWGGMKCLCFQDIFSWQINKKAPQKMRTSAMDSVINGLMHGCSGMMT